MLCDVCDFALKGGSQGKESCVLMRRFHSTFIKTVKFSKYIYIVACLDRFEGSKHMLCFVWASKLGGEP